MSSLPAAAELVRGDVNSDQLGNPSRPGAADAPRRPGGAATPGVCAAGALEVAGRRGLERQQVGRALGEAQRHRREHLDGLDAAAERVEAAGQTLGA